MSSANTDETTRIACLRIADLPLYAEFRAHPELQATALAIVSGADAQAEVLALSPTARAAGIGKANSIAQARAICPHLQIRVASPALDRAAREALLDVGLSTSPRAEFVPRGIGPFCSEGGVFVDARGVAALFQSEQGFASALLARAEAQGLPGVVAIASSRTTALLAARHWKGELGSFHILATGKEKDFLDPLPLDLFDPDDRLAQTLTRLGIRNVRDLLKLPRRGLSQRLGLEGLALIERARGRDPNPGLPEPTSTRLEEAMDLEHPIENLEALRFVLRGLISRLIPRLELRALACGPLDLRLGCVGGGLDLRRIGLATPTLDLRILLRLATLALAKSPPSAPIEFVSIGTEGIPGPLQQLDFFIPRGPDPNTLSRTLSELESLCGEGRVGVPEVGHDHHPSRSGMRPFSPPPKPRKHATTSTSPPLPALRALRPPIRAEVRIHRGQPSFIRSAITRGDVLMSAGPWRTTGNWWSARDRFAMDHFDIQVSDGLVARLCFDWMTRTWQIDGIYD